LTNTSPAGAGKTKLISKIIDELSNRPDDEALAFFYCNRDESSRRDPANILRSFVKQLSTSRNNLAIQDVLVDVYKKKRDSGFASATLTPDEAESLLPKLMEAYSRTTLIVDALDECEEDSRRTIIDVCNRLTDRAKVKILVSSRRDRDINQQLEKGANLGIEATDNGNDISRFVYAKINEYQQQRRVPLSDEMREEIVRTLLEKSDGM
jgi:hypothetical protein